MKSKVSTFKTKKILAFFMALVLALTSFPLMAFATDESGEMPQSYTNSGNPFVSGAPSENYRIPQLVTMNDGTLVAQADARWNNYADGGGNDSVFARSTNNGNSWTTSFVTYYPDNGNTWNPSSTSICDSALATNGDVLYSLSTFFPAGYALNGSSADHQVSSGVTAFDGNGNLLLSRNGSALNYHLGSFSAEDYSGRANIYYSSNNIVSGYTVDHDFYLYNSSGDKLGNLFYSDCEFQTAKTNFLMFRSSTDGGQTWSPFKLLNVKKSDEAFYGVGPGRGVVTEDGTIIFGCYKWNGDNSSQRSSFIYSKDGGNTWTRMGDLPQLKIWGFYGRWTSECQPVLLSDGTIRLFCRSDRPRLIYADAKPDSNGNYQWVSASETATGEFPVHVDQPDINGDYFESAVNNQYSVIKYSKQVLWNGNYYDMLIASHALVGGTPRTNGAFTFMLLDDNNNIVAAVQRQFTYGQFEYSCLTELKDGRIGILYEYSADGKGLEFDTYDIETLSGFSVPDLQRTYDLDLVKDDSVTYYVENGSLTSNSDPSVADAAFTARKSSTGTLGTNQSFNGTQVPLTNALYTFTQTPDGTWYIGNNGVYLTIANATQPSTKDRAEIRINQPSGTQYFQFIRDEIESALYFWRGYDNIYYFDRVAEYREGQNDHDWTLFELFRPAKIGETTSASDPVPGYVRVTSIDDIQDGEQYLIGAQINPGEYYFLYPSLGTTDRTANTIKSDKSYVDTGYYMTINALDGGETTMVCGNNTYNIEVSDYSREITGVVDYDPVIYTQGSDTDITSFGSTIADGSTTGEKYTSYRLNDDNYEIVEVVPLAAATGDGTLSGSSIELKDGKVTGYLNLADNNNYNDYDSGTYVTLKTTLRDSTGMLWTQTDRLYVASSPVPGHLLTGNFHYEDWWSDSSALATFILAEGSYGNTKLQNQDFKNDSVTNDDETIVGNAKILFNEDGIMQYNGASADIAVFNDADQFKTAGIIQNAYYGGGNQEIYNLCDYVDDRENNTVVDRITVAYYYYDKSSDKNEGITVDPNNDNRFSIGFRRQAIDISYSGSGNGWDRGVTIGNNNRSYVTKRSGEGTIENNPYMFGAEGPRYYVNDKDLNGNYATFDGSTHFRQADVWCNTTVQPDQTTTLRGELEYQEGAETNAYDGCAWNNMSLTFEVKMCDKSPERDAYEEAISTPRKSTWYTTSSWYNYMQAVLIHQEYLNNYTLLTPDDERNLRTDIANEGTYREKLYYEKQDGTTESTMKAAYDYLTKRADFTELENALADREYDFETGIIDFNNDVTYTVDSVKALEEAYNAGLDIIDQYPTEESREDLAGYEIGPDSTVKKDIQNDIDAAAAAIKNAQLKPAADDSAFVAAKDLSQVIDKTAYNDNGATVEEKVSDGDDNIYAEYNNRQFVNIPRDLAAGDDNDHDGQDKLDTYTKALVTEMNVGSNASSPQVKTYHVDYEVNGEKKDTDETAAGTVTNNDYKYGEVANIDLSQYNDDKYTVKVTLNSVSGGKTPTTYNLEDHNYKISILIQEDIEVRVEVTENEVITVKDYYGTVIGIVPIPENGAPVTIDENNNLIINGTTISPKNSPKYEFTGWSVKNGDVINEATEIRQRGTLNAGVEKIIKAVNGTVNGESEYRTEYFDVPLELKGDEGDVWVREVDGNKYLASYDSSFTAFTANENVTYTAYTPEELQSVSPELASQYNSQIPAVYGTGYFTNGKFTLSVDYSAPAIDSQTGSGVKVVETGVVCSNTDAVSTAETLVKGGKGAAIMPANRVAHWNGHNNSGTYTSSLTGSDTGTYYMRAYVCYTMDYNGEATVPYIAYCDRIFKCVDGKVSVVD